MGAASASDRHHVEVFNRRFPVDPGTELAGREHLCQEVKRHVAFESAAAALEKALNQTARAVGTSLRGGLPSFVHDYANSFFATPSRRRSSSLA